MTKTHLVQVVIDGKIFTMGGTDDETHIQRVASYVNQTIQTMKETDAYKSIPADLKPIFIELNIADELITAQDTISQLESDLQMKENELSQLKQTLVETQLKMERTEGKKRR